MCFSEGVLETKETCYSVGLLEPFFISSAAPVEETPTAAPLLHLSFLEVFFFRSNGPNHQACHHYNNHPHHHHPPPLHPHLAVCFMPHKNVHPLPVGNYIPASCLTAADKAHKNKSGLCFPFFSPCLEIRQ